MIKKSDELQFVAGNLGYAKLKFVGHFHRRTLNVSLPRRLPVAPAPRLRADRGSLQSALTISTTKESTTVSFGDPVPRASSRHLGSCKSASYRSGFGWD